MPAHKLPHLDLISGFMTGQDIFVLCLVPDIQHCAAAHVGWTLFWWMQSQSGGFGRKMLQSNGQFMDANAQARALSSGNTEAFARATATAFHNGGSEAQASATAISSGIMTHGCGFYQKAFAQVMTPFTLAVPGNLCTPF